MDPTGFYLGFCSWWGSDGGRGSCGHAYGPRSSKGGPGRASPSILRVILQGYSSCGITDRFLGSVNHSMRALYRSLVHGVS